MAKFILTNSLEKTEQSVRFSTKNGYIISGQYKTETMSYASYYKLAVSSENFLALGEDFVSVVGTVIYKDSIGKEALKKVYDDFTGDVNIIRYNILGNGAFIIKKGEDIPVFNDFLSLFNIFYSENGGNIYISNDLYDVCYLCNGLEADPDNLILRSLIYGPYGGDTEIKGVKFLQDCEKIVIDAKTGKYKLSKVDIDWGGHENYSYEEIVSKMGDFVKSAAATLVKHFGTPALSSTGGLDNRWNLAALLAVGCKPDLYYGIGNSSMTNTYSEDLNVNKKYQEKYGLNLNVISWKNANPIYSDWDEYEKLYGFHSVHYSACKDFNENYRNIKNKLILMGFFGEIHRIDDNSYMDDVNFRDVTLDEYIDMYPIGHYWDETQLLFKNKERIHAHLKEKLLPLCEKWGINPNQIRAKDDIFLWLERMHRSDNFMINLMNRHHFCIFLNAQCQIVKLLTMVHPEKKSKARFQIDVIKYMCPSIMDIPIFSRCQIQVYDEKTNTMQLPASVRARLNVKATLKKIVPESIYSILRFIRQKFFLNENEEKKKENECDKPSIAFISQLLESHGLKEGEDCTIAYRDRLSRPLVIYAQYLNIFDHLKISFHK